LSFDESAVVTVFKATARRQKFGFHKCLSVFSDQLLSAFQNDEYLWILDVVGWIGREIAEGTIIFDRC